MAKIKIEDLVKHLGFEFKKALAKTVRKQIPEANFDERELFTSFLNSVSGEFKKWENIPDEIVEKGDY